MTMQNVVTNQARPFWLGGLSKSAVTPSGGSRAGAASKAANCSGESDIIVVRTHAGPGCCFEVEVRDTGLQASFKNPKQSLQQRHPWRSARTCDRAQVLFWHLIVEAGPEIPRLPRGCHSLHIASIILHRIPGLTCFLCLRLVNRVVQSVDRATTVGELSGTAGSKDEGYRPRNDSYGL